MKQELIQLLQHEDQSNRLIGCWLAWHEGYGTIDIFDMLVSKKAISEFWSNYHTEDNKDQWRVGNYVLQVSYEELYTRYYSRKKQIANTFIIVERINDKTVTLAKIILTVGKNHKLYTKAFNNFKHMFMEYVLTE